MNKAKFDESQIMNAEQFANANQMLRTSIGENPRSGQEEWHSGMTEWFCETKIKDAKCIFDKEGTSGVPEGGKQNRNGWEAESQIIISANL